MVSIQHRQQKIDGFNWTCGSTCLEMIFDFFGIPFEENEIWEAVKTRRGNSATQWFSLTFKLAQYSIEHGLSATIYKAKENKVSEVLDYLNDNNIPAILSIMEKKSKNSHFVVYTGKKDGKYLFADPNSEKDTTRLNYVDIRDLWKERRSIDVAGHIFIGFGNVDTYEVCKYCTKEYPVVHNVLLENTLAIICPYCDRG